MYAEAVAAYGSALGRLARGYEVDGERRRDLLQDIHLALWQSLDRGQRGRLLQIQLDELRRA